MLTLFLKLPCVRSHGILYILTCLECNFAFANLHLKHQSLLIEHGDILKDGVKLAYFSSRSGQNGHFSVVLDNPASQQVMWANPGQDHFTVQKYTCKIQNVSLDKNGPPLVWQLFHKRLQAPDLVFVMLLYT